jgi:hypothetical protein
VERIIIHLCADTGSDSYPYQQDSNYKVVLVGREVGVENYHPPANVTGIIANPVCTHFSQVRRGRPGKDYPHTSDLVEGMRLVNECLRIIQQAQPDWWVLENPATGSLHQQIGKPQATYQPWYYGSPWTKKTALWGRFNMPDQVYFDWQQVPGKVPQLWIREGRKAPSLAYQHKSAYKYIPEFQVLPKPQTDAEFRSYCSQKFANLFKECNL